MSYLNYTKDYENFMQLLLRDHKRYLPIVSFVDNVTQQHSELTWQEREYIATDISRINGSGFCAGIHNSVANALRRASQNINNKRLEPIVELARKFNDKTHTVQETDLQAARDSGWSDQTIEDVAGLVAIINFYNSLAKSLGFKALPSKIFDEMGAGTIQMHGYEPMFHHYINENSQAR